MASKKKEGFEALKTTKGGTRRDDRQITSKTVFDPINITAHNALTVICMLKSPENDIVVKALASLDAFASKLEDNLRLLTTLGICSYLLPLIRHEETLIKRFAQKLIGELCGISEFREQILAVENILNTFVDILVTEKDVVIHEFVALALAALSSDYEVASALLQVDGCPEILFTRITSADPDVQKNCLEIMNHLLDDVFGIEAFVESPDFDITLFLILMSSSYPVIQSLVLEVLIKLTSWCRDPKALFAFRDALGLETVLTILEKSEWKDLHETALDLLLNVADNPDLCDYLLHSGCLVRIINILDNIEVHSSNERILGVLARMSQTKKGRIALCKINMMEKFCEYLQDSSEAVQESACLGIGNLAQWGPCLDNAIEADPIPVLIGLIINEKKNLTLRNLAAYALNILCNQDSRAGRSVLNCKNYESLTDVLFNNEELPAELCKNVVQIFTGISLDDILRRKIITRNIIESLLSCLQGKNVYPLKDTSLQVDALECLTGILVEEEAILLFLALNGVLKLIGCLRSKYASLREWGGHLIVVASQFIDFVKVFINLEGLNWLFKEKNTRFSMPSWEAALEAIFSTFLPAKFAFTGRLDLDDITEDGFYVITRQHLKFFLLEECLQHQCVPLYPVYFVTFNTEDDSTASIEEINTIKSEENKAKSEEGKEQKKQNFTIAKQRDKNINEIYSNMYGDGEMGIYSNMGEILSITYSNDFSFHSFHSDKFENFMSDPYLPIYLENLKKKIAKEESAIGDVSWRCIHPTLVQERARIIAEFVAHEMAGTTPNAFHTTQAKDKHISELKFQLGTNILPIGIIKAGSFLERAMLFKVLADRIGFPCALVRNEYGKSWIEIAIPIINVENFQQTTTETRPSTITNQGASSIETTVDSYVLSGASTFYGEPYPESYYRFAKLKTEYYKGLPNQYLKTNAIIDLVHEPGKIIKLNSAEAEEYVGISRDV